MNILYISGAHPTATEKRHIAALVRIYGVDKLIGDIDRLEQSTGIRGFWKFGRKGYDFKVSTDNSVYLYAYSLRRGLPSGPARPMTIGLEEKSVSVEGLVPPSDRRPTDMTSGLSNCGVVAVSVVLDRPYTEVENRFRNLCGFDRRWGGRTNREARDTVVQSYGHLHVMVEGLGRRMVATTCKKLDTSKRYIIRTGGHAMALVDGVLVDQNGTWNIEHPKVRRRIVTEVFEVYPE